VVLTHPELEPGAFITSAPSLVSVKNQSKFSNPPQPWSWLDGIVVGGPALGPMGSWSSHLLKSKFPPGAQLGLSCPRTEEVRRRNSKRKVVEYMAAG
jgi:hypothetical protein